jgi:hypothetical protein
MREWLLGIVGIVFCGIMIDVLSPNGKLTKLIKGVFGIIATFVIISPIFNIDINRLSYGAIEDTALIEDINNSKVKASEDMVELALKNKGFDGVDVEISINTDIVGLCIENVYIDCSELVLTDELMNINKYEVIVDEVASILNIDKERIVIYG